MTRRSLTAVIAALIAAATVSVGGAGAAAPTPPFNQCPGVGYDTSCALLIYITATGSVGVAGDPTQLPFDGVEDTLIGVQNNSGFSIASIPIAASSGKALFGFDNDGLCSGVNSGGGGGTFLPPPTGCPFGSTGYEGPGVSFTGISGDFTGGTVSFSPAIAPGGHAYFSLEEALATVPPYDIAPGPPTPTDINMVSLGDSYSSGDGTFNYDPGKQAQDCRRGPDAWPRQLQQDVLGIKTITHLACSGAKSQDLFHRYRDNPPQINLHKPDPSVQLVTLTIGGDDLDFPHVLRSCFVPGSSCANVPDSKDFKKKLNDLALSLKNDVYPSLRIEYPNALIVHVGYPRITPPVGTTPVNCGWLSVAEQDAIDKMTIEVEDTIQQAVLTYNDPHIQFASVLDALKDHWLCTQDSWMVSVNLHRSSGHPNVQGQTAYMKAVANDLGLALKPGF